jgi:hypothetical protein
MGLSFAIAAGPCQCIHSRILVPWDSRPYFTVSDSRLSFLLPVMARKGYGGDIRPGVHKVKAKVRLRPTVSRSNTHLGLTTRFLLLSDNCVVVDVGRSLWREDGSVVYNCYWSSLAQSFSGPIPVGLATIFYCLRFETSFSSPPTTRRATVEVFDPASTRD